ncbi:uncharacterized protein LOC120677347 [Panicum virgatum]|uniref:uncharacterized protein LOC120677347 n=1 Tax=Panicum virgatum TaxID=38727 RepID=UPI0019D6448D|nr:uncharacterized protein LOC120677347 [Panicum virgatum]
MRGLVAKGLLCHLMEAIEWILPEGEREPKPPSGYVVSFACFYEWGFASPPHAFFQGLLHHYDLELQHLDPNGIQHIAAFIALCEGFLGAPPFFQLFRYLFSFSVFKAKLGGVLTPVPIGCASIRLRRGNGPSFRADEYMPMALTKEDGKWHATWFYIKNYEDAPLPLFTNRIHAEKPRIWGYDPEKKEERLADYIAAIHFLKRRGLTSRGVVGAYHSRRVAPIMARALALDEMVPDAAPELIAGAILALEPLSDSEIQQRITEAFPDPVPVYPDPNHPVMRLMEGFVPLDGYYFRRSRAPLPEDAVQRVLNRSAAERRKGKKDARAQWHVD